jgi:hypothetical protein
MKVFYILAALTSSLFLTTLVSEPDESQKNISRTISSEERNCTGDGFWYYDHSNENPTSQEEYCSKNAKSMIRRFCFLSGRLGYSNNGGLLGLPTGVCWWHSQFHRNMTYLSYFDPSDTKDISDDEFKDILKKISKYEVVKIRKYKSFFDLISDEKFPERKTILKKFLQNKMAVGTLKGEFFRGFNGKANKVVKKPFRIEEQREDQKKEFAEVYQLVRNADPNKIEPAYVLIQHPGLDAHSAIVYDAEIVKRNQYQDLMIYVQDSNYQTDNGRGRLIYVFDEESAQWFNESEYKTLQQYRENNTPFVIIRAGTTLDVNRPKVNEVGSQSWTIKVQREKDNDKINDAFKAFCDRDLFIK